MGERRRTTGRAPGRSRPGAVVVWGLLLASLLTGLASTEPVRQPPPDRQQAGGQEQQGEQQEQEEQQQEQEEPPEAEPPPPALPDLRIVRIDVTPHPVPAGGTARVDVVVHNDSTVPAAGRILLRAVHDRPGSLPVPGTVERVYFEADALVTVSFDLYDPRPGRSPYELVAAVDVVDDIDETREDNNVAARRLVACSDPPDPEVWDGVDNDCDGEIDEETSPANPRERLLRMRAEQQRSLRELIPLVFGIAQPLVPYGREYEIHLRAASGAYVSVAGGGGGAVSADRAAPEIWETFTLVDHDGGDLASGDTVSLLASDGTHWIVAPGGGGGGLHARAGEAGRARLFVLTRAEGPGTVTSRDRIHLRTSSGHYVVAEGGGGGVVNADRDRPGPWETFVLEIPLEDEWEGT